MPVCLPGTTRTAIARPSFETLYVPGLGDDRPAISRIDAVG
jgi:hypothetical protein